MLSLCAVKYCQAERKKAKWKESARSMREKDEAVTNLAMDRQSNAFEKELTETKKHWSSASGV